MRRISLILLLLGMLLAVGNVGAQEEETILNVRLECDCETDSALDEIVSQLEANLVNYDIRLEIAQPDTESAELSDWDEYLLIRLRYQTGSTPDGDNELMGYNFRYEISSKGLERAFAAISPLLNHDIYISYSLAVHYSLNVQYSLSDCLPINACDFQVNSLTVISLYLLNRCDSIEDFLSSAPEGGVEDYPIQLAKTEIRANCAILNGDYLQAQEILETVEFMWLQYPVVPTGAKLAWLYLQNGQSEAALNLMNEAVNYSNDYVVIDGNLVQIPSITALKFRAQIYALTFDYDSAIADMDDAIRFAEQYELTNTELAELYTIRGQIVFLLYEWDRVLADFNHAIELDPNYAPAYFERGVLYYTMTQRENALADFEHYLELEPDGLYAEEAATYIESIHVELEALGG